MIKRLLGLPFVFVLLSSILVYTFFYLVPSTSSVLPKSLSFELYGERCTDEWMFKNVTMLKHSLDANVFGQHVATKLM